jgi:glucose/mannose-6-phosphate isomerase
MYLVYDKWPELAKQSYQTNYQSVDYKNIDNIVFAGMGGSGTIADILSSILSKTNMHSSVVKGYTIPRTIDSNTLLIITSISGNTEETLHVLKSTYELPCKIIAFSSGGKMKDFCLKNKVKYYEIQHLHSPRASFPIFLYSMLKILIPVLPVTENDVKKSLSTLENLGKKINSNNLTDDNLSLDVANWIRGMPLIYYPFGLQSAAIRFKNSLNENAKLHAMAEDVIESCHNGIVSWETCSNVQPILIQGKDDFVKTKDLWKVIKEYFQTANITYKEIYSCNGGILEKLIYLIYLLDYSTIYLSVINNRDPTPINSIDFMKSRLYS